MQEEIYFDVLGAPGDNKRKLARLSMEGSTIHRSVHVVNGDARWIIMGEVVESLIPLYVGRHLENPFKEFATLRQTRSVEEFVEPFVFELLSSQVVHVPKDQYLGYFIFRMWTRTFNPQTWMQMIRSKNVEEELHGGDGDEDWGTNVWEKNGRMGCYEGMCPNSSQLNLIVTPAHQ